MKIYIVKGTHWDVPTLRQAAALDAGMADVKAAEMVALLWSDSMEGNSARTIQPAEWRDRLLDIQALRYGNEHAIAFDKARATLVNVGTDDAAEYAGCDVWIETLDVDVPTSTLTEGEWALIASGLHREGNNGPMGDMIGHKDRCARLRDKLDVMRASAFVTVWHAFADTDDGGSEMHVALSEREGQDWLLGQFGQDRETFDAFMESGKPDGYLPKHGCVPEPVEDPADRDINSFLRAHCGGCDNWGLASADIPLAGFNVPSGRPRIIVEVRGGQCSEVYCDQPAELVVLDYDAVDDGEEGEVFAAIPSTEAGELPDEAEVSLVTVLDAMPEHVAAISAVVAEYQDVDTFLYSPETCPSKHWNRGDDICADCGENLAGTPDGKEG